MLYTKGNRHTCFSLLYITHALNFLIASCKCGSSMHTLGHVEHKQENTMVHKRQVARRLAFPCLSKRQVPVHLTNVLVFYLKLYFIFYLIVH
jgi:hypothetical protein